MSNIVVKIVLYFIILLSSIVNNINKLYTYTTLDKYMYVTNDVNVRDLPYTNGKILYQLSYGDRVYVTGQCNETKWYRINQEGQELYISNNYLVDTLQKEVKNDKSPKFENSIGRFIYKTYDEFLYNTIEIDDRTMGKEYPPNHSFLIAAHYYNGLNILWDAKVGDTADLYVGDKYIPLVVEYVDRNGTNTNVDLILSTGELAEDKYRVVAYTCNLPNPRSVTIVCFKPLVDFPIIHTYYTKYTDIHNGQATLLCHVCNKVKYETCDIEYTHEPDWTEWSYLEGWGGGTYWRKCKICDSIQFSK